VAKESTSGKIPGPCDMVNMKPIPKDRMDLESNDLHVADLILQNLIEDGMKIS
jgi:hypothetical protein